MQGEKGRANHAGTNTSHTRGLHMYFVTHHLSRRIAPLSVLPLLTYFRAVCVSPSLARMPAYLAKIADTYPRNTVTGRSGLRGIFGIAARRFMYRQPFPIKLKPQVFKKIPHEKGFQIEGLSGQIQLSKKKISQ